MPLLDNAPAPSTDSRDPLVAAAAFDALRALSDNASARAAALTAGFVPRAVGALRSDNWKLQQCAWACITEFLFNHATASIEAADELGATLAKAGALQAAAGALRALLDDKTAAGSTEDRANVLRVIVLGVGEVLGPRGNVVSEALAAAASAGLPELLRCFPRPFRGGRRDAPPLLPRLLPPGKRAFGEACPGAEAHRPRHGESHHASASGGRVWR